MGHSAESVQTLDIKTPPQPNSETGLGVPPSQCRYATWASLHDLFFPIHSRQDRAMQARLPKRLFLLSLQAWFTFLKSAFVFRENTVMQPIADFPELRICFRMFPRSLGSTRQWYARVIHYLIKELAVLFSGIFITGQAGRHNVNLCIVKNRPDAAQRWIEPHPSPSFAVGGYPSCVHSYHFPMLINHKSLAERHKLAIRVFGRIHVPSQRTQRNPKVRITGLTGYGISAEFFTGVCRNFYICGKRKAHNSTQIAS